MNVSIFEVERIRKGPKKGLIVKVKEDKKSSTTIESIREIKDENGNNKYIDVQLIVKSDED